MKIFFLVICLHLTTGAFAEETKKFSFSEVKAQDVSYNGRTMVLTTNVSFNHHFGRVRCDKATLLLKQPKQGETNNVPEQIVLEGNVYMELKNGNSLESDKAEINCTTFDGVFTSISPHKVVYITYMGEGENKTAVKTSSQALRLKMKKEAPDSDYAISEMKGEGVVSIEYMPQGEKERQ